ncbi:hypothetical protein ARMSODRAFT_18210 [Armillaria solidipes]|uniref:Uncharacterized protein n=1 Tax=Armillaria solidipes TaxID=1076256 RepID=A0A2H3CFL7_9AGAR|nr:hypothetical protein ARMSODRAFT_18210 [Armillaria solidipes]
MMYHQFHLLENTIQCDCLYIVALLTLFTFGHSNIMTSCCSRILQGVVTIYMALLTAIATWVLTDCNALISVHSLNLSNDISLLINQSSIQYFDFDSSFTSRT